MAKDQRTKIFEHNSLTIKLLAAMTVMLVVITYLLTLPLPPADPKEETGIQTQTPPAKVSNEEKRAPGLTKRDLESQYFEMKFMNIESGKVIVLFDGYKMGTIDSRKYLSAILSSTTRDELPFFCIFFSYFTASLCIPVGSIYFNLNSSGVYYDDTLVENDVFFRRLCMLMFKDN